MKGSGSSKSNWIFIAFTFLVGFFTRVTFVDGVGTCKAGELRCQSSGLCVSKEKVCDGVRDCDDGLDENELICSPKILRSLCGAGPKKVGVFQCEYGGCIPLSRVCDGNINCLDGSDESEHICGGISCLPGQFRCKYGACISDSKACNGMPHCPDGSDESEEVCKRYTCKDTEFQCNYGACIPHNKICDGWKNCGDGSDEIPELCYITRAKMKVKLQGKPPGQSEEISDRTPPTTPVKKFPSFEFKPPTIRTTVSPVYEQSGSSRRPTQPTTTTEEPLTFHEKNNLSGFNFSKGFEASELNKSCTLPELTNYIEATISACRSNPDADYCMENSTTVPSGVGVDYSCSPGYGLKGPPVILCKESGAWSSPPPICELVIDVRGVSHVIPSDFGTRCPPITPTRGVQVDCIQPGALEVKNCLQGQNAGVEAKFTCQNFYRPSADLPLHYEKCGEDGKWTPGVASLFTCVPDCGVSEGSKTPYITNGQGTKRGQWPWHVGLYFWINDKLRYLCGAVLITESAILTSAHCVVHGGHLRNATSFVAFLGKQNIDLPEHDPFVQIRRITKIFVEESFNHLALDSDIAILALETPAVLSFYVRPVCYPQASNSFLEEYQLAAGNFGTVLGWGLNENGTLSGDLRMTELPVVSPATCSESHPEFFASMTRSTTYCGGYRNGTAVCNGDSGGGMYFKSVNKGNTRWYVQGLVSYGVPQEGSNGRKCSSTHYAVFTRVGRYGDWLVRTLSKENLF